MTPILNRIYERLINYYHPIFAETVKGVILDGVPAKKNSLAPKLRRVPLKSNNPNAVISLKDFWNRIGYNFGSQAIGKWYLKDEDGYLYLVVTDTNSLINKINEDDFLERDSLFTNYSMIQILGEDADNLYLSGFNSGKLYYNGKYRKDDLGAARGFSAYLNYSCAVPFKETSNFIFCILPSYYTDPRYRISYIRKDTGAITHLIQRNSGDIRGWQFPHIEISEDGEKATVYQPARVGGGYKIEKVVVDFNSLSATLVSDNVLSEGSKATAEVSYWINTYLKQIDSTTFILYSVNSSDVLNNHLNLLSFDGTQFTVLKTQALSDQQILYILPVEDWKKILVICDSIIKYMGFNGSEYVDLEILPIVPQGVAIDSLNRIWISSDQKLYLIRPTDPIYIRIEAPDNVEFDGTPFEVDIQVSAVNIEGNFVETDVLLLINSTAATFLDGTRRKAISTSSAGPVTIPIRIEEPGSIIIEGDPI